MFKSIGKGIGRFLLRNVLPFLLSEVEFRAGTKEKKDGFYFFFYLAVVGLTIVDLEHKFSGQSSKEMQTTETLRLEQPLDIALDGNQLQQWQKSFMSRKSAEANKELKAVTNNQT